MSSDQHCQNHPFKKATSYCHHCNGWFCHDCLREGREYYYCLKPDCQRALQDEEAPKEAAEPSRPKLSLEDWLSVHKYPDLASAREAVEQLVQHGIEWRIQDDRPIPPGSPEGQEPDGDVFVLVKAVDSDAAMKIIGFNL